jgi:transcriptional repressor NF-X1
VINDNPAEISRPINWYDEDDDGNESPPLMESPRSFEQNPEQKSPRIESTAETKDNLALKDQNYQNQKSPRQNNRSPNQNIKNNHNQRTEQNQTYKPRNHRNEQRSEHNMKNRPNRKMETIEFDMPASGGRMHKLEDITGFVPKAVRAAPDENNSTNTYTEKKPKERRKKIKNVNVATLVVGHSEFTSRMITDIIQHSYECMVCVDRIGVAAGIWSCKYCFRFFHMTCLKKWRTSCLAQDPLHWKCPHCRKVYSDVPKPSCFCGKSEGTPPVDPYLLPHTCGEVCGKLRTGTNCPHPCSLLCHPGPCPDCPALAPEKPCYCGKTTYRKRCGQEDPGVSCGNECEKLLNCGRHYCSDVCHAGDCPPCKEKMNQTCYCGKEEEERICGSESLIDLASGEERHFSCNRQCGRELSCGNHFCEEICHPSYSPDELQCAECPLSPSRILTCPCGKTPIEKFPIRKSCLDPIPTCKSICGKLLRCGKHTCKLPCHTGPCTEVCNEEVIIPCRCGESNTTLNNAQKIMKCWEVYPDNYDNLVNANICKRVCRSQKECGVHICGVKCCPVNSRHVDPEGFHVCRLQCPKKLHCGVHKCPLTCHRGKCPQPCLEIVSNEDRTCPCGRTTQEAPIICGSSLPVCKNPCPKQRLCGHPMTPHLCHWTGDCPPCVHLESKRCACGANIIKSIACYNKEVTCGSECGRALHCGQHKCTRKCHTGPCEEPPGDLSHLTIDEDVVNPPPSCGQLCKKPLPDCLHFCKQKCHPGRKCPEGSCKQKSQISCDCGRLSNEVHCVGKERISLPCDDICKKEARSRQLAIAFGFLPSGLKPPSYNDFLVNVGRALPRFLLNLETKLNSFVRGAANEARYKFPPMDPIQRKIVHDLSRYYFLEETIGPEPQKLVTLIKKNGSRIPNVPLSQMAAYIDAASSAQAQKPTSLAVNVPVTVLHIYGISPSVKTSHLEYFLEGYAGEYALHWIDESNAIAIFKTESTLRRAMNELSGKEFKIKVYQDSHPEPDGSGFLVLNSQAKKPVGVVKPVDPSEYRLTTKPAKPKTVVPSTAPKPWVNAVNSFSVLGEKDDFDDDVLPPIITETKPKPDPVLGKENWEDDTD